jgi:putative oxidoreductase
MARLDTWTPRVLSLLRIITALLFMEHGLIKLFHFPERHGAPVPLPTILLAAAVIEVAAGVLLTLGLFTRAAAFVCAGEMMVAYFIFDAPQSPWPALNQGDVTVLFCWVFFYLVFAGGGPWSLDGLARRRRG